MRDLPLPVEVGDVSFEPPSGNWSAQLSRITINLFLFGVGRSGQPPRPAANRIVDGRQQRRPPIPMLELNYLVTAWAGVVNDEHQLIGELLAVPARQVDPTSCRPTWPLRRADDRRPSRQQPRQGRVVDGRGDDPPELRGRRHDSGRRRTVRRPRPRVERVAAMVAPHPDRGRCVRVSDGSTLVGLVPGPSTAVDLDIINTGAVIDGVTARVVGLPEHLLTSRPAGAAVVPRQRRPDDVVARAAGRFPGRASPRHRRGQVTPGRDRAGVPRSRPPGA